MRGWARAQWAVRLARVARPLVAEAQGRAGVALVRGEAGRVPGPGRALRALGWAGRAQGQAQVLAREQLRAGLVQVQVQVLEGELQKHPPLGITSTCTRASPVPEEHHSAHAG